MIRIIRKEQMRPIQRAGLTVLMTLLLAAAAWAQQTTGTILGNVVDASGAVIRGAKVTISNTEKNEIARTVVSNEMGAFTVPNLPVGVYSLEIEAPGFKTFQTSHIQLNVNDERRFNARLETGVVSEKVEVEADPLEVETQSAAATGLITGTQIRELALKSRNYEELVALMPGVTADTGDTLYVGVSAPSGGTNEVAFSINGSLESQNNWTIDGADNVDRGGNFTLLNYPSVDAISEFKVLRGNYNAEYGRGAGGQINLITRSGTSTFHGSAYEFFRNDALDANNWLNKHMAPPFLPQNPLRYNDFGGTIGGPVFIPHVYNTEKNKTFFFYSEELRRVSEGNTAQSIVPNAAERGLSTGGVPTFADPVCVDYPTCSVVSNQIPISAINPASAAYLKDIYSHIPLPQDPVNHILTASGANRFNYRQEIVRIDHNVGEKLNAMFRYMHDNIPTVETGGLFNGNSIPDITQTNTNSPGRNIIGKVTYIFTPTLINEAAYAYSYGAVLSDNTGLLPYAASPDVANAITLPFPNELQRIPNIGFSNGTGFFGFGNYRDYNRNHNFFDNLTTVHGSHSLKFGISFNAYQKSENAAGNNTGSFSFSQGTSYVPCCDTDPANAGNPSPAQNFEQEWANFLTGHADNFTQLSTDFRAEIRQKQIELYAQDEYRARPNLTVSYGVRYSLFLQPTDANHRSTSFDPTLYNPANAPTIDLNGNICTAQFAPCAGAVPNPNYDPLNGIIIGNSTSPYGAAVAPTNKLLFQPRIGVAWDPTGRSKTSVRAGYGIFVESPGVNYVENAEFSNPPFVQNTNINNPLLSDPAAGIPANSSVLSLIGVARKWHQPYVQQYNLDMQHEFARGFLFDVGYYGSRGVHLLAPVDINQPAPGAYVNSPVVQAAYAAQGIAPGTLLNQSSSSLIDGIRPYLGYGSIDVYEPEFTLSYNSLQTSVQKRLGGGSQVSANYTYSKALTNEPFDPNYTVPLNTYDLASEYGPTRFDRRHTFTADFVYELPFLRQQRGFVGHALGGWEFSGIVSISSGAYLTPTTAATDDPAGLGYFSNPYFSGAAGPRPDQISDPNQGAPHSSSEWFNTAAFVDVTQYRAGNAKRATILGPGAQRWDLSLFKNFKLYESLNLQFRAEAFNVFNHTNYSAIDTQLGSAQYGQVVGAHDPRILQLALKLEF